MKLFLIRHGQTALNVERKFYGSLDVSLTEQGVKEALLVAEQLKEIHVTKLYTSGLQRTTQTAAHIIEQNKWTVQPQTVDHFNEKDMGIWEGLDADQIEQLDFVTWQQFLKEPFLTTPKQAESFDVFCQRIEEGFEQICTTWSKDDIVLIVGHHGVLRHLARRFLGEKEEFFALEFKQGCVYEYEWNNN